MKSGAIRQITWGELAPGEKQGLRAAGSGAASLEEVKSAGASVVPLAGGPQILPTPTDAVAEAKVLLRIAAEVEGALMAQYLYTAYSILPGVSITVSGIEHPILSDDWYDVVRDIAKQEMGHLITVQNLLLSLNAVPHVDRENFPWTDSGLYPFPFHLQKLTLESLAKDVAAEAPRVVDAADQKDYKEAVALAKGAAGQVSRVGQIYERLYFLFQDDDRPQAPWSDVSNPFPAWPTWHVPDSVFGFNQDRQAQSSEWRGDDATGSPDTAIYVLPAADRAAARVAIFKLAQQGEGPPDPGLIQSHFDKFLRLYREFRAYDAQGGKPAMVRNQAVDPATGDDGGTGNISDPATLQWARLANSRYRMLLLNIALALSIGNTGSVPGTTAARRDFVAWAIGIEMLNGIKKLGEELRAMPLTAGGSASSDRAGLPFELPRGLDLPTGAPEQVAELRSQLAQSQAVRDTIRQNFSPTPRQQGLLTVLDNADKSTSQKIGT